MFVALRLSLVGTKLPFRDVRDPVATGGITDMGQTTHFGSC